MSNTNIISQAKHICGPIGYADYRIPGSDDLGDVIAKQANARAGKDINALRGHQIYWENPDVEQLGLM